MLLGRERERAAIDGLLATIRSGRSAVLALVGEAGIGKTSILTYAEEEATGLALLRARGVESEMQLPFAGLYEMLRPALHLLGRIPAPRAAALEVALALRPNVSGGDRFAVGAATLSLLAAYAEEAPTLLLIDDAHLLDASSAEAIRFALRRMLAEPLGAVLAVREDEPSLLDDADLPTLHVVGLDRAAATGLLGGVPSETADRLYLATAGNPLALTELARDTSRLATLAIDAPIPVPAKVTRAFARRAALLDASAQRLLALATVDESADLTTIDRAARLLDLDAGGLAAAEKAGLVRIVSGRVEFRHALARAAIYGASPPEYRREAHRALARALPDRDVDRRAWHLGAAATGTDATASAALEQAGLRARQRSAYAVSSAAFERAARLAPNDEGQARLLAAAAETTWLAGFADRAIVLLQESRALAMETDLLVQIDRLRGQIAARRGPVMEGHAILVAAADRVATAAPDLAIGLLADAVDAAFYAGDVAAMAGSARRMTELLSPAASTRSRFLAAATTGMAMVFTRGARLGIESMRTAKTLLDQDDHLRHDTDLLPWIVMVPLYLRESGSARSLVDEAIDTARARAALGILPWLLNRVARDHAGAVEWSRASVEYDEAVRLAHETGQRTELGAALAGWAWLEARQGREADCRAHAAEALTLCAELGTHLFEIWAIRALGELELGLGRASAAIEHLEDGNARLEAHGIEDVDLVPNAELIDAYLRVGRRADAEQLVQELDLEATRKGQPWSLARAARCRGLVATDDEFEHHFDNAVKLHVQTPDVFELGITRFAYGGRLRRQRQRTRARDELRMALEIFEGLGAQPWAEMTRGELLATGETARRRDASATDTLTRQELRIAQILATGRTTRETAAALFLSPKTIEYHLRSIYGKLGISSRGELASAIESRD
ncbi:MAG: AAA family ATPase [Candidatus Dormiibacterota bacterium]